MDLGQIRARAVGFQSQVENAKARVDADFSWYPYDSLSNIEHLDKLLEGELRDVIELLGDGRRVLDIGAADGEWSFLLESLGCEVVAVDYALTNANEMRGITALKNALRSKIEIIDTDIDNRFYLPEGKYDIAFFLGILYHLKNPFFALEKMTKQVKYLFLSTRVARVAPSGVPLERDCLAYLLGPHELNGDRSNYWIFSEPALRRLVERAGWQVLAFRTFGSGKGSDTNSLERDERAFCLLRSAYQMSNVELLEGWHRDDQYPWCWTEGRFSVAIPAEARRAAKIALEVYVPPLLIERLGTVTLEGQLGASHLEPMRFEREGEYQFVRALPPGLASQPLHFSLNKCLAPSDDDPRELGIIVSSIRLHF